MIVTLDSGILVRATLRSSGPARQIIQSIARDTQHQLVLSPYILSEVGKVLSYSPIQKRLGIQTEEIHQHLEWLRAVARVVNPPSGLPVVLSDPKDDPVLYTAVAGGAEVLCTRDRAFYNAGVLAFAKRHRLQIVDDLELLAKLRQ